MPAARETLRQLSTFTLVGIVATAVHVSVAWGAHVAGLPPQGANFTGWLAALVVSFLGQARLTFRVEGALLKFLPRFAALSGLAFVISATLVAATGRAGLPFWTGLALVAVVVPPASFLAQRFFVFDARAGRGVDPGLVIAAATGAAIYLWFRDAYVNHDVAWYLVAGRQWIEGARLYADLSEVNPPLAFYLIRGALHLGDVAELDPSASLAAFAALITAGSLAWTARLVPADMRLRPLFLTLTAAATTLPFLGHFGQREHLMLLLILPWVAAALFHSDPLAGKGAVLRGLVAGVGICLKPHFLVYPAALTLAEMARTRSIAPLIRPGNLAMGAVGVVYVAAVLVLHPEYFGVIVPDARLVYGAYVLPFDLVVSNLWPYHVAVAFLILAAGRRGVAPGGGRALIFVAAAFGAYALQGNGFTYHAAPLHALAMIGLALIATGTARLVAGLAAAMIAVYAHAMIDEGGYRNPLSTPLETRLTDLGIAPERLLVWSPSLLPAFPLVLETGAEWTGHAASLWLLPGTLDLVEEGGAESDPRQTVLARSRAQMARDLARCPDVLILDRMLPFREKPLDVLAYAGPETSAAVARAYDRVDSGPRFDILIRRTPCG